MGANPIHQIEEAIFLLRKLGLREWTHYLLAAVPFLLMLLTFVHDMSSGYLAERCVPESLACALVFFWSSAWKARFGGGLLAAMNGPALPSPLGGFWRSFYLQSVVQSVKLVAMPFAAASVLPVAWTSSFFRNAVIEASQPNAMLGIVISKSAKRASANARGQWIAVFILTLITLLVFINLYIATALLPLLIRAFSGYENLFTRRFASFLSFDVFCVVAALTWLLIDPLIFACAAVRCFYAEARTDGRDLLAKLRPAAVFASLALFFIIPAEPKPSQITTLTQQQLSQALEKVSQGDDYGWLRARKQARANTGNPFLDRISKDLEAIAASLESWFKGIGQWLRRLLEGTNASPPAGKPNPAFGGDVRVLLYGAGAIVLIAAIFLLVRSLNKPAELLISSSSEPARPDLNKDNLLASDLPEEEWLRMSRELLAQGELRLAVRAMYLSNLSYLASRQFIQVAKAKSNSVYERELRLRPRGGQISAPFCQSNRNFERAWYGFHAVTAEFVEIFQRDVEAIRQYANA